MDKDMLDLLKDGEVKGKDLWIHIYDEESGRKGWVPLVNILESLMLVDNKPLRGTKVSSEVLKLEKELGKKLDEYFPKGHKYRDKAMVIFRMSVELGVQGHANNLKQKSSPKNNLPKESKNG